MQKFNIALVVNPYAGLGGAVALKGSDGPATRAEALARGAQPRANARTQIALRELQDYAGRIQWYTAAGDMGESALTALGYSPEVVYKAASAQTEAADTQAAIRAMLEFEPDLLVFAGGDGTARDVVTVLGAQPIPVIGIPAGVKIHSGVYGVTPAASGKVVRQLVAGELATVRAADVMDIDEAAFRSGTVKARRYGELQVPGELEYIQAVKMGGREQDELVLADIAADVVENMEDQALYIMGSGSTVGEVMRELQLPNTLLGVDVVQQERLLAQDVTARELEQLLEDTTDVYLVLTLIGGQGHLFGRGNQQLSPRVIRQVGKDRLIIVASKEKLQSLGGRPLIADTGEPELDRELAGFVQVVTGYHDRTLVAVAEA